MNFDRSSQRALCNIILYSTSNNNKFAKLALQEWLRFCLFAAAEIVSPPSFFIKDQQTQSFHKAFEIMAMNNSRGIER